MTSLEVPNRNSEIDSYMSDLASKIEGYVGKYNPITPPSKTAHRGFHTTTPAFVSIQDILRIAEGEGLQPVLVKNANNWELYTGNREKYDPLTGKVSDLGKRSIRLFGDKYVIELVKGEVFPQLLWGNYRNGNLSMPASDFDIS